VSPRESGGILNTSPWVNLPFSASGSSRIKDETFLCGGNTVPCNLGRFACTFTGIDIRKN
jgi:hypothetical protein